MATVAKKGVVFRKPKSIWQKEISVDFKPLFKALGKATAHTATLKLDDLADDAADAISSIGLDTTLGELAFSLIQRALFDAMVALARESASHLGQDACSLDSLSSEIEAKLNGLELKFDSDFFKQPSRLPLLRDIEGAFSQWLCDAGTAPRKAELISKRLHSYFVFELANEWKRNSSKYQALLETASSPFAGAEEYEQGWLGYFAALDRRIAENVFDEPFSLEQIYVPLNAYYRDRPLKRTGSEKDAGFLSDRAQVVVSLEAELRTWLNAANPADALRVISGGPGSGKSSFTKIFCAKLAREGNSKPLYIPLHLIDPTRDVGAEVERFVFDEGLLGFNPLDSARKEKQLLLVFDGLDELASQGKIAAQVTRDFVQAVEKMVERRNMGQHPIFVLLSGREVVVQENETEFRKPHQVLSLLPYFTPESARIGFVDPDGLLKTDWRNHWWINYGKLTGADYVGLPEQLMGIEIDEITAQPLLNYLVALSYTRGKLNFDKKLDLNSVYADLVAAVHERGYEKSRTFRPIRHISADDFLRVLEEIGLAAWHGSDGRSTSVKEIMEHCKQSGLETLLNTFKEGAQAGVTKLLAAFFFRRNGEGAGEDAAFVFTHKSFGEYLTAVRLTRGIERIAIGRKRRANDPDDGFDVTEALVQWGRLTGPAAISPYIQTFLKREIARRDKAQISEWQRVITELAAFAIERHLPVERLAGLPFAKAFNYDANGATALMIVLSACTSATGERANIQFASPASFGTFLRRVCPQRRGPSNHLMLSVLNKLDLSKQCLDMVDLYGANLESSALNSAEIHFGVFDQSNLEAVDLSSARLGWSRFGPGVISNAKFDLAHMGEVSFRESKLTFCSFIEARLDGADFTGATLLGCNFSGARLFSASLQNCASIKNCDFDQAVVSSFDTEFIAWFDFQKNLGNARGVLSIQVDSVETPLGQKSRRRPLKPRGSQT